MSGIFPQYLTTFQVLPDSVRRFPTVSDSISDFAELSGMFSQYLATFKVLPDSVRHIPTVSDDILDSVQHFLSKFIKVPDTI